MANFDNIKIRHERRLCEVGGKLGYFHFWGHWSRPVEPSPMIGGAPAEVFSAVFGIVEFADGIEQVNPTDIKFCDDENSILSEMQKIYEERKET